MKSVNFEPDKIRKAIDVILEGMCKRVDLGLGVKVYSCKNIIRIDIPVEEKDG